MINYEEIEKAVMLNCRRTIQDPLVMATIYSAEVSIQHAVFKGSATEDYIQDMLNDEKFRAVYEFTLIAFASHLYNTRLGTEIIHGVNKPLKTFPYIIKSNIYTLRALVSRKNGGK